MNLVTDLLPIIAATAGGAILASVRYRSLIREAQANVCAAKSIVQGATCNMLNTTIDLLETSKRIADLNNILLKGREWRYVHEHGLPDHFGWYYVRCRTDDVAASEPSYFGWHHYQEGMEDQWPSRMTHYCGPFIVPDFDA